MFFILRTDTRDTMERTLALTLSLATLTLGATASEKNSWPSLKQKSDCDDREAHPPELILKCSTWIAFADFGG